MTTRIVSNAAKNAGRRIFPLLPIEVKRQAIHFRLFKRPVPKRPVSFNDKVNWRILHDRRDIIARGGDKIYMKEYAERASTNILIPETLWIGQSISTILDHDWACEWVLKPRVGSGYMAFGSNSLRDSGISVETVSKWRHMDHFNVHGVWGYGQGQTGFFLEQRIPTPNGAPPDDIKFFVFQGEVRLIQVDTSRADGHKRRFYDRSWRPLDVTKGGVPLAPAISQPQHLEIMRHASEILGADYDFIRVDLYDTPQGVYFGELSPYPAGGTSPFSDPEFDRLVGSWWRLPTIEEVRQ